MNPHTPIYMSPRALSPEHTSPFPAADEPQLIRQGCRKCRGASIVAHGGVTGLSSWNVAILADGTLETEGPGERLEQVPDWETDGYRCTECGEQSGDLDEALVPDFLQPGDRVECPDGYEGFIQSAALVGSGRVVAVVGGCEYDPQELRPLTGPLPERCLFDTASAEGDPPANPGRTQKPAGIGPPASERADHSEQSGEPNRMTLEYWAPVAVTVNVSTCEVERVLVVDEEIELGKRRFSHRGEPLDQPDRAIVRRAIDIAENVSWPGWRFP